MRKEWGLNEIGQDIFRNIPLLLLPQKLEFLPLELFCEETNRHTRHVGSQNKGLVQTQIGGHPQARDRT